MLRFVPEDFWGYVITAWLGSALFGVMRFLAGKARRVKEIERVRKIELARIQIMLDSAEAEVPHRSNPGRMREAMRAQDEGVKLAHRVYEIDMEELGGFWRWIGGLLGRIL